MSDGDGGGREQIREARQMAQRTIEQWQYLDSEEKYGTLHEIVDQLTTAERAVTSDTETDQEGSR
jgi:hypothetical protein